jgi:hypothetical protein
MTTHKKSPTQQLATALPPPALVIAARGVVAEPATIAMAALLRLALHQRMHRPAFAANTSANLVLVSSAL